MSAPREDDGPRDDGVDGVDGVDEPFDHPLGADEGDPDGAAFAKDEHTPDDPHGEHGYGYE